MTGPVLEVSWSLIALDRAWDSSSIHWLDISTSFKYVWAHIHLTHVLKTSLKISIYYLGPRPVTESGRLFTHDRRRSSSFWRKNETDEDAENTTESDAAIDDDAQIVFHWDADDLPKKKKTHQRILDEISDGSILPRAGAFGNHSMITSGTVFGKNWLVSTAVVHIVKWVYIITCN